MASETFHRFTDEGDIYELPSLVAPTFCKFFVSQPQVFWCNATLTKLQVFCGAVVQCLSLLHNFIQLSLNSGSVQFQILLAESQGSLTLVSAGNKAKRLYHPTILQKQFIIIIIIIIIPMYKNYRTQFNYSPGNLS